MSYQPMQVPIQPYAPQQQYSYAQPYNRGQPYQIPPGTPPDQSGRMMEASNAFRAFDNDHSGTLKKKEFRNVLASLGYPMDEQQAENLFHTVDSDRSGKLDEREFVQWWVYYKAQLPAPQCMQVPIPQQFQRQAFNYGQPYNRGMPFQPPMGLDPQAQQRFTEASTMFRQYDQDNSGQLKKKEFRFALRGFGYYISEDDANRLFATVDKDATGKLDEREFCEFWVFYRQQLPAPGMGSFQQQPGQLGGMGQPGMGGQMGAPGMM